MHMEMHENAKQGVICYNKNITSRIKKINYQIYLLSCFGGCNVPIGDIHMIVTYTQWWNVTKYLPKYYT